MFERENTVAIIGGLGKMGQVEKKLHERAGYSVIVSDLKGTTISPREAIRRAGIIFFSVWPIENIGEIINATRDEFNKDHIVLDNASIKHPLRTGYEILDEIGAHICSTHPLHKENQPPFGQNDLVAPFGRNPEPAILVAEDVHQKAGMIIIRVDFDRHDALLVVNQGFPHLRNRAAGSVLVENDIRPDDLDMISTANSRMTNIAMWRTLVQESKISAGLIADMLKQPEGRKIIDDLLDAERRILEESSDPKKLETSFEETVNLLDPTGETRKKMDQISTIVLQNLGNLAKRSLTIETHGKDRSGLLRDLLDVIANRRINLNTVLSEIIEDGFKFHLGIESGNLTPEVIQELEDLGFHLSDTKVE